MSFYSLSPSIDLFEHNKGKIINYTSKLFIEKENKVIKKSH